MAAYRKEGAAALAHPPKAGPGRIPLNATPMETQQQVVYLAQERNKDINNTHLTELLAEWEGVKLSRPTVRRIPVRAGVNSPPASGGPASTSMSQAEDASERNDAPVGPWRSDR